MRLKNFVCVVMLIQVLNLHSQDTFSILGIDSITGEIGAAGASCVDLFSTPFTNDFICELFPDTGAIASQASYITTNQAKARARMRAGDTPSQILSYVYNNDANVASAETRQYGALRKVNGSILRAAFTGTGCLNYKNHIVGPNYTIHGNILLGQKVLDSMQAGFLREKGDLACKLMAAMQGAKMIGADSRCAGNGSSSYFAFLKVTLPTDTFGKPHFIVSVRTHANAHIEPIDSLQKMFSAVKSCTPPNTVSVKKENRFKERVLFYPNPSSHVLIIKAFYEDKPLKFDILDIAGKELRNGSFLNELKINSRDFEQGVYFIQISNGRESFVKKVVFD